MTYAEALGWLYGLQRFGIKLGLENIRRLLRALNVPAPEQRVIHVAGTNGKGSVCAMIDSILQAAGYSSGLFTSPHLVTFRERIQVNGEMISEDEVAAGLTSIRETVREWDPHPTFFEIATALGLAHFKRAACEFIVLETGMGGRLDATNAVAPIVSVITPIDYDHEKWLGHTLPEIAAEKAGIIKSGVPVISAAQKEEAAAVIRGAVEAANKERHSPGRRQKGGEEGAASRTPFLEVTEPYAGPISLTGAHQKQNAAVAIAVLNTAGIPVIDDAVHAGLTNVSWPARFQRWDDRIVIDGAHNPAGARILAETWRETYETEKAAIVLAILQDKDAAAMTAALAPLASEFVLPPMRSERAFPAEALRDIITKVAPAIAVRLASSIPDALAQVQSAPRVLVTGSLHFAGEVLAWLRGVPAAFEECAQ